MTKFVVRYIAKSTEYSRYEMEIEATTEAEAHAHFQAIMDGEIEATKAEWASQTHLKELEHEGDELCSIESVMEIEE
jgi:hypothetical protein